RQGRRRARPARRWFLCGLFSRPRWQQAQRILHGLTLISSPVVSPMIDARNLAFQAQAIWPQECTLFARYRLSGNIRILDLGCGTGEITRRLAQLYPQAMLTGVDILDGNLALARNDGDA